MGIYLDIYLCYDLILSLVESYLSILPLLTTFKVASGRIDDLGEQQNRVPSYGQSSHGFSNIIGDIYTFF